MARKPLSNDLTPTQRRALAALRKAGGTGVLMANGSVLAAGQVLSDRKLEEDFVFEQGKLWDLTEDYRFSYMTWVILERKKKIEIKNKRVRILE